MGIDSRKQGAQKMRGRVRVEGVPWLEVAMADPGIFAVIPHRGSNSLKIDRVFHELGAILDLFLPNS